MGYITYKQADSRWGSRNYNGSSTMATAGCGPTAVAMLAHAVNPKITPIDTMKFMQTHGDKTHKKYAVYDHGTAWNGIPACMKYFGLEDVRAINVSSSMYDVWKYLAKGYCAVFLFSAGSRGGITWTTSGHYVAVTDYKTKNGKHYCYTRDSGGRNHTGFYCYETQMRGLIPKVWVGLVPKTASKKKEVVKAITKPTKKYSGTIAKPTIKFGSSGAQVKYLQKFLNWYGSFKLTVDGEAGPKTLSALAVFQKTEGLTVDEVYGTKSYNKAKSYKKEEEKKTNNTADKTVLKIIDVSAWQKTVDWKKVASDNIDGAIIRSSYTSQSKFSLSKDSTFTEKMDAALKNNLAVGAYHYSQAISVDEAKKEAEYICKLVKPYKSKVSLPIVCDWEFGGRLNSKKAKSLGKTKCTEIITAFCKVVKSNGYTPMVYANYSTFSGYLNVDSFRKSGYLIWLAQYSSKASMNYDMWQYSSSATVKGISGKVDINKTSKNIIKKVITTEPVKPAVTEEETTVKKILKKIDEFAWPAGTPQEKWAYSTGSAKAAYKTALKKYMNKSAKISQSDCGYFINTIIRMLGIDDNFLILPSNGSKAYPKVGSKFKIVHDSGKIKDGELKAGDIIRYRKTNGGQHTMFFYGDNKIAEAGRNSRFPAIKTDDNKYNKSNVKHSTIQIIRLK